MLSSMLAKSSSIVMRSASGGGVVVSPLRVATRTSTLTLRATFSTDGASQTGMVKWYDNKKGFGFITPDDGSPDIFVHQSVVYADGFRSLADGEPVEFTKSEDAQGRFRADRVTGPMGAFVQGQPYKPYSSRDEGSPGRRSHDDDDDEDFGGSRKFNDKY